MARMASCLKCGEAFTRPTGWPGIMRFCSHRCSTQFYASARANTTAAQFWAKVAVGAPGDCWEWTATIDTRGYGQIRWHGRLRLAHRIALSLTDGDWESRLYVCHSCDNKKCCNPAHLWRGTAIDNVQDMLRKQRNNHPNGEAHRAAKLTAEQVLTIRSNNESTAAVAARFGVCLQTIRNIRAEITWRHLP